MEKYNIFVRFITALIISSFTFYSFGIPQKSDEQIKIDQLINEGLKLWKQKDVEEALKKFKISLEESKKINYKLGVGYSAIYLVDLLINTQPQQAHDLASEALEIAININDKRLEGKSYQRIGEALFILGNLDEALRLYFKVLEICRNDKNISFEAYILTRMGEIEGLKGNEDAALEYVKEALEKAKAVENENAMKDALFRLGKIYFQMNEEQEAMKYFNQALQISKRQKDVFLENNINAQIAHLHLRKGEYHKAIELFEKCYEFYKKHNLSLDQGLCLSSLGMVYFFLGHYEKARNLFNEALEIFDKIDSSLAVVATYLSLSSLYIKLSDFLKAYDLLEKTLKICREKKYAKQEPLILINLGELSYKLGNFLQSEKYLNYAIKLNEELKDQESKVLNYNSLGNFYHSTGDILKALEFYHLAKNLCEEIDSKGLLGTIYSELANFYLNQGDTLKALDYINKAIDEDVHVEPTFNHINNAVLCGGLNDKLGDKSRAFKSYKLALSLSRRLGNKEIEANCLKEIGKHFYFWRNYTEAINYLTKSLSISKEIGNKRIEAIVQGNLALNYFYLKIFAPALAYINNAIEIDSEIMNKLSLQWDYDLLGKILLKLKKEREALSYLRKSEEMKESTREATKEKEYSLYFLETYSPISEELLLALEMLSKKESNKNLEKEAFMYLERGKARALLDMLGEAKYGIRSSIPDEIRQEMYSLYAKIGSLRELYINAKKKEEIEDIRQKIVSAEEKLRELKLTYKKSDPNFASIMYPEPIKIEFVQKEILKKDESALIEYYTGIENSYVFVVTHNDYKLIKLNRNNEAFSEDIKKLRRPFENIKEASFLLGELRKFDINLAHKLYNELILPAIPYLSGIKKLIIVPQGSLNYLPFEMLVSEIDEKNIEEKVLLSEYKRAKYLIEDYSISYAPSSSVLDPRLFIKEKENPQKGGLLAITNPDFGKTQPVKADETITNVLLTKSIRERIESLPYSEMEVREIKKYFIEPLIYSNEQATEENLVKHSPNYPIIHLSTHGFLNEFNPIYSSLVFAYNENIKDVDLLHTYEIFNLALDCDLVTLSACETALGQKIEYVGGEGVIGLSRAFLYAGAKSLLVSLWKVSDESTSILMAEFYRNLKEKGLTKIEALRQAKLALMKKEKKIGNRYLSYSHPFFWAPFILIGQSD